MRAGGTFLLLLLATPATSAAHAQSSAAPDHFDVASIKPNLVGGEARRATASPGGVFTAVNVSLRLLISRAYGIGESQIEGGPRWVVTDTWDVSAKADTPREMTREQLRPCLQALLAERFHLRIHRQVKQGSVLSLEVAKNGPKLKEHIGGTLGISLSSGPTSAVINASKATMALLAEYLTGMAGRPVLDHTGLSGEYDFSVEWSTDDTNLQQPSIFAALQEQLGLKLEATQGPIETIVVDQAERASAN